MVREEAVQRTNTEANVRDNAKRIVVAVRVCTGITCIVILVSTLFLVCGVAITANQPHCAALYFGTKEPHPYTLPDLRNLSVSEWNSLLAGRYKLSIKYKLKLTEDILGVYSLCVLKRRFTHVSACVEIGTVEELQLHVICGPDMRPDCLPGSIVGHSFGLSLWKQEESTVEYTVVNIDSSEIDSKNLTNTTRSLSSIWFDVLNCQDAVNWLIAVMIFGILVFICCLGLGGCCLWICCHFKMITPAVSYRPSSRQDLELMISQDETAHEGSCYVFEDGNKENAVLGSLVSSEVHQNELSNAWQGGNLQLELPAGGASSRESVRTAVSERGYRRQGRRSCSMDTTSMSGAATDASTIDASDEDSSVEGSHANGLLSTSSTFGAVPEEATDHKPESPTEPGQALDGVL